MSEKQTHDTLKFAKQQRRKKNARKRPEVSVAIITENSCQHLQACLESIYTAAYHTTVEIIVVDNGSRDGTGEMLRTRFGKVRVIVNARHRGIAPARNQALQAATGEFVLLVDVDARLAPGAIDELIAFARRTPEAGIVGPKIIDPKGNVLPTCRRFPTINTTLLRRMQFIPSFRHHQLLREQTLSDWDHDSIREVDYVIGACQLIRQEVIREVGLFDEKIFTGPQDADYCLRTQAHGWKVFYFPDAVLVHLKHGQRKKFLRISAWKKFLALFYFFQKHGYLFNAKSRDYAIIMPRVIEYTLLFISDFVAIVGSYLIWAWVRGKLGLFTISEPMVLLKTAVLMFGFWFLLFLFFGLYRAWYAHSRFDELVALVKTVFFGVLLIFFMTFDLERDLRAPPPFSRLFIVTYWMLMTFMLATGRMVLRTIQRHLLEAGIGMQRTLIVGWNKSAWSLLDKVKRFPALGYRVIGFIDVRPSPARLAYGDVPMLGTIHELSQIIQREKVENVLIALSIAQRRQVTIVVNQCTGLPVTLKIIPDLYSIVMGQARTNQIYGFPLIEIFPQIMPVWERRFKRLIDLSVALTILILGLPLWLLIALAIRLDSAGPIFYRQERIGKDGRVFTMIKFRSMVQNAENLTGPKWAEKEDPRITRVGRLLRKWRLDEFPQFINVLRGEMSLVGPRPERPYFVEKLKREVPFYARRLKVQPGITGWAQVKGTYDHTIEDVKQKLQYDFFYVENMSLVMDFKILLHTVYVMLAGKGQ
ncbi:MAG: exopolysaccharide biosynthesis polyprenyl glycosylphosphotransferase [candidate division KSB1 bacterium]|nr:exopolysaccharide biosynthesis polyprenyl glycosylphosphotransferase [candidate division KSB1 bacterium]